MKHKSHLKLTLLKGIIAAIILFSTPGYSQFSDKLKDGLKFYTDTKDSSHFVRLNLNNQIWARYTFSDPLTVVNGYPSPNITDLSIRRVRAVLSGQLNDRVAFFMQFGQNNLNYLSARKAGAFFHDVTADYTFIKKYLSIGFGLNGWNGPSRFSNISTSSIMALDPPNYQEVTNDTYDQFVRRLGVYMKGKLGKLDYRLSAGKPFVIQTTSGITDPINTQSATFSTLPPQLVYQGYFMWQFLDQESNFGPSTAGTYLGKKKVFNIGAGFYNHQGAMYMKSTTGPDTLSQDIMLLSADVFLDMPINKEKGNAVSFYAAYSNYNYGTKFIKVTGPDNPATGVKTSYTTPTNTTVTGYNPLTGAALTSFNKASYGNAFPYLGTGQVIYAQAGYKFKDKLLGETYGTLQLYANGQYALYDRLSDPMLVYDIGVNWLIKGQNCKFTLDYQDRPFFLEDKAGNLKQYSRYGQIVLQYQVCF
ncbi:MAG: hypothetical protein ACXVPN_05025 [Bacteroidia bacterium]